MTIKAHGNLAPSRSAVTKNWKFKPKNYPHFDSYLTEDKALNLVTDPEAVAKHNFYPFLCYYQKWTRFRKKDTERDIKERPIRYACRADSYIYSYYRYLLSSRFEAQLEKFNLKNSVLAYRQVVSDNHVGKCNIHFTMDAINKIRELNDCYVLALDISSFFESIDHKILKSKWCELLGVDTLPADHYKVYKAITSYSVVYRDELWAKLGYLGDKYISKTGEPIQGYLVEKSAIPQQLFSGKEFRRIVAGGDGNKSLIHHHRKSYGIPQGSPISDLLANFYLIDFDREINNAAISLGGQYFRYSDDILIILPTGEEDAVKFEEWVRTQITAYGSKLKIKASKSAIFHFHMNGVKQDWRRVSGEQGANGLEYLGFRYDGKSIFLRDSTLSRLQRKMSRSAKSWAMTLLDKYPNKSPEEIVNSQNFSRFFERYGRVGEFETKAHDVKNWTFWTYAHKAASITAPLGLPIYSQMRNYKVNMRHQVLKALIKFRNKRNGEV